MIWGKYTYNIKLVRVIAEYYNKYSSYILEYLQSEIKPYLQITYSTFLQEWV